MTIGSLFSGIGALELALESCGMGPVIWQAESDEFCRDILAKHWPATRRYNDVRDIDGEANAPAIICGGFPCQPVSLAGKRLAQADPRWLWPEFARIICALRPGAVFIENVPGLRTAGLRDVLADLARLGFDAEWDYFTAAETGAPHIRRRLFVLAYSDREQLRSEQGGAGGEGGTREDVTPDDGSTKNAPNPYREWELQPERIESKQWGWSRDGDWWNPIPAVCGVDDGASDRPHREKALGNAVVWQCAALAWRELSARAGGNA